MASNVIICSNKALPKSIDVNVQISKPQTEDTIDLSTSVFVSSSGNVLHGVSRVSYYDNFDDLVKDYPEGTEVYNCGRDYFAQSPRAKTLAIGRAFDSDQAAYMISGQVDVASFSGVSSGGFDITINGTLVQIVSLDFSADTTLQAIANTINTALNTHGTNVTVYKDTQLLFVNTATGDGSTITGLSAPTGTPTSTDVSGPTFLNAHSNVAVIANGYTYTTFSNELELIYEASLCSGKNLYGWILDAFYRDKVDGNVNYQLEASQWMEARLGIIGLISNSPLAYNPASTQDIGYIVNQNGATRTFTVYHDIKEYYPEASILSYMLSVNYSEANSTATAKFKDLPGIPTVGINSTQLAALTNKRYNTFTLVGKTARTYRDGTDASPNWFMDDLINLDNYGNELSTEVYNVFLRNNKVPYDIKGVSLIRDAIFDISSNYVTNGTFAPRPVKDPSSKFGVKVLPAFQIIPTPIQNMSDADRANRVGPPFVVNVQLAGAIHTIAINVNAYS